MSASLVGSEMCIRDSINLPRIGLVNGGDVSVDPSALGMASAASTNKTPVSYTHLTLPTICSV
eukprot:7786599-Alexandrium_andersonii.AAC.1